MLIVMAGLPGAGKSTLAQALARTLQAALLSVDPVEAAMWHAGVDRAQPTGLAAYVVVEAVASQQLALGSTVIVDAVNDVDAARQQWVDLARRHGLVPHFVEVVCSDALTHRRRLEARRRDIDGFSEPSWESVQHRAQTQAPWRQDRLVLDSMRAVGHNLDLLLDQLRSGPDVSSDDSRSGRLKDRARPRTTPPCPAHRRRSPIVSPGSRGSSRRVR